MKRPIFLFLAALGLVEAEPIPVPGEFYKNVVHFGSHPGVSPFLSDLSFRAMSDWVIDQEAESFDPDVVERGDTVYVNVWLLPWFEKQIHPRIRHPYILISCDVGNWVPDPAAIDALLYDPKCAAWFCRNIFFSRHPKITQIPMGQTIYLFEDPARRDSLLPLAELIALKPFEKKYLLYMNHYPRSYGGRDWIVTLFEKEPYCYSRNHSGETWGLTPRDVYYKELSESVFTLSPLGLEIDCVRTWEAFVLDCIPIVEHTFLDPLFDHLPIVIVYDWSEIDEPFLRKELERISKEKLEMRKAYFPYWRSRIQEAQKQVREGETSFSKPEACLMKPEELQQIRSLVGPHQGAVLCRGFLTGMRSTQLAEELQAKIFLFDPWMTQDQLSRLCGYADDFYLSLKAHTLVSVFSSEAEYDGFFTQHPGAPVFLDLEYYRNSLLRDFACHRHRLEDDLLELFRMADPNTVIVGNQADDPYVQKVLQRIPEEAASIETRGRFWRAVTN